MQTITHIFTLYIKKMTIENYQELFRIQQSSFDEVDKMALMVCCLFNIDAAKVDNMQPKKFLRLMQRLTNRFENTQPKWYHKRKVKVDATTLTASEFVELQHWMKSDVISNLNLIVASILLKKTNHKRDANRVLKSDVAKYLNDTLKLIESLKELLENYKGLFESDSDAESETHNFIETYGWFFSIESVAEYLRITINDVYKIGVLEFLNSLSYLKNKQKYLQWQAKQH